jgi:hypothetical protein
MQHHFDTEIAAEYSVDVAIIVNNLDFWLQKNKANDRHYYDGKTWMYNSVAAFVKLFPYWSDNQIRRIIKKMETDGIIETGNYNKVAYDRTTWYTFTDAFCEKHKCILRFAQMEVAETPNGSGENHTPIPDSNPDSNPDGKHKRTRTGRIDATYATIDGENLPINAKRYDRLRKTYGAKPVTEAIESAYRFSLKKRGDSRHYKDYTAAAEDYMKRDGVKPLPPPDEDDDGWRAEFQRKIEETHYGG